MSTRDPFETPPPQDRGREPDSAQAGAWSGDGGTVNMPSPQPYPQQGYAAPGYAAPQQPAPGFAAGPPGAHQPAYGYQAQPQTPPSSPGMDGPSIAALVTGVLGLGPVAVVLGAIGLRRTSGGQRKGTGLAVAGLVLGLLGTIIVTAALTWSAAAASDFFESDAWTENTSIDGSGETYGDDAFLDGLWDECEAGDDAACDDLYAESPWGSEYEEFGSTCGERGRPAWQLWCDDEGGW